jgi:DNA-binding LacI/PurR family transcriptional regulator
MRPRICAYDRGVPKRVTIVDLAGELGLSKSLVANALHGYGRVSPETRERVVSAARRMGYTPNQQARNLRALRSGSIGVLMPPGVRSFAFYMEFTFGVLDRAAERETDVVLLARSPEALGKRLDVDGAVVVDPVAGDKMVETLVRAQVPLVSAGRVLGQEDAASVVEIDHTRLVADILDRLRAQGIQRPALICADRTLDTAWSRDIRESYLSWTRRRDVAPLYRPVSPDVDTPTIAAAAADLVDRGADALLTGPQGFAARLLPMLRQRGLSVPDFPLVSLVADPQTELADPRLTAVDLAPRAFGWAVADVLFATLDGEQPERTVQHPWTLRWADPPA